MSVNLVDIMSTRIWNWITSWFEPSTATKNAQRLALEGAADELRIQMPSKDYNAELRRHIIPTTCGTDNPPCACGH